MLVAEKAGIVYSVTNGVKRTTPLWTRTNEVLNEHDRGLLSLAVDPNYVTNHYIYLLYTVDPDSNGVDTAPSDAFCRLVRYRISFTDSNTVDYTTRTILMGVSPRYDPLSASPSHTIGAVRCALGAMAACCRPRETARPTHRPMRAGSTVETSDRAPTRPTFTKTSVRFARNR